jgi:hypothetical protein
MNRFLRKLFLPCIFALLRAIQNSKFKIQNLIALALMIFFSEEAVAQACTLPEARIMKSPVYVYDAAADLMTVTVPVGNTGSAAFASPFRITVYRDEVGNARRYTHSYNSVIAAGGTANITFGISNFKAEWTPFDTLVIRINDSGNGDNSQQVCGSDYRDYKSVQLIASDDYMLIFNGSADNQFRVAINDILPASYVSLTVNILNSPAFTGTASVGGSTIFYTPAAGQSADTLRYRIHCGNAENADTATVYIKIIDRVDNIGDAECFVEPISKTFTFNKLAESPSAYSINNYNIPLVGDIDNDGFAEIIVSGTSESGVSTTKLYIFEYKNGQILHQQTLTTPYFNNVANPYSIAKVDGNDYAAIFLCTDNTRNNAAGRPATDKLQLIKYIYNGTQYAEQTRVTYSSLTNKEMAQPMISDFNGDGIPEVVTYDKVFNARTMTLLADGNLLSNNSMGFGFGGHFNNNYSSESSSMMAIADMDGDGVPEVIGGNCVYKINITNPSGITGNSYTLWSQCDKTGLNGEAHGEAVDGATAIADMDDDGLLDIIVTVTPVKRGASSYGALYIWNPRTKKVMHTNTLTSFPTAGATYGTSVAFIGDVDNDKQPEICLTGRAVMYAFEYNPLTRQLTQKWSRSTSDDSGATTMSMFDFNQDGNNELVYRDQTYLRILNGTNGSDLVNPPISCTSATADEYPVVADINDDGAAEIIVTGGTKVWVYASNPAGLWAPARKVWNQFAYNAVNINEDLTVPRVQMNPATIFPGTDGQLGTSDDIRPYNGYLQQQTTISKNGTPYWEASDYALDGIPTTVYYSVADSLSISFCVTNYGDVQGTAPFYVSVYKNARQAGNVIVTKSFPNVPAPGQTVCYSLKLESVLTIGGLSTLHLWLNDSGNGTSANPECDYTNGVVIYDVTGDVAAQNDYASLFTCDAITIPILANDVFSGTTFTIMNTPKYGTAVQSGGALRYTNDGGISGLPCEQTGNRIDTVHYKIESIIVSDAEAYAVVKIYSPPDMMLENACSANPKITLSASYDGFTYDWEYSPDGASGWQFVATDSESAELNFTGEGFYRVTINYDGNRTYRLKKGIKVSVNRTTQLPGGIVWYDTSFNTVTINWQ